MTCGFFLRIYVFWFFRSESKTSYFKEREKDEKDEKSAFSDVRPGIYNVYAQRMRNNKYRQQ